MKSFLVASSKSRVTEVYRSENGKLYRMYHFKSGAIEVYPVAEIPPELTLRYDPPIDEGWEFDPNMSEFGERLPAIK
ncbi:MAG: hypothetical protein WC479_10055 [Candidatus Izemoplasmatales bacterium]